MVLAVVHAEDCRSLELEGSLPLILLCGGAVESDSVLDDAVFEHMLDDLGDWPVDFRGVVAWNVASASWSKGAEVVAGHFATFFSVPPVTLVADKVVTHDSSLPGKYAAMAGTGSR